MNLLKLLFKKILYPSCAVFTLLWVVLCAVVDSIYDVVNINLSITLMCLAIAVLISVSNLILGIKKISSVGRYFLHMLASIVSVTLVVAIFSRTEASAYALNIRSLYLILVLVVAYVIVATPSIIVYNIFFAKEEKVVDTYKEIFKKK